MRKKQKNGLVAAALGAASLALASALDALPPGAPEARMYVMHDGAYRVYHARKMIHSRLGEPTYWITGRPLKPQKRGDTVVLVETGPERTYSILRSRVHDPTRSFPESKTATNAWKRIDVVRGKATVYAGRDIFSP